MNSPKNVPLGTVANFQVKERDQSFCNGNQLENTPIHIDRG
jgi:hypothetical protein